MNTWHAGHPELLQARAPDSVAGLWDRRAFLAITAVAMGAMAVGVAAAAAPWAGIAVVDRRLEASRAFAAEVARSGARIACIDGDITEFWYGELDQRWRREKVVVSGLTEYAAFFCLERLAMDRDLRAVFKGEHRRAGSNAIAHTVDGARSIVTANSISTLSDASWPQHAARLATAARDAGPITARHDAFGSGDLRQPPLLISWVIAPKRIGDRT